ncbi:MAG: sulfurtransferase [Alphaproteobacteria bacterium]|nr:sulfurtransferase [Alphaproteobacteria bacterium]
MTGSSTFASMDSLVSTEWLSSNLGKPGLLVFDCTCLLTPDPKTTLRADSGRPGYEAAHIPGAGFLDITGDLSDPDSALRFTMPKPERLAAVFGDAGIGDGSAVVLYAKDNPSWATRMWWMLRVAGFDNAAVLDGGLAKWQAEGRPVEVGSNTLPAATLTPHPRPDLVVDAQGVTDALAQGASVINALGRDQHRGDGMNYGRPGRIAGSVNVPSAELIDPETKAFKPETEIRAQLESVGALQAAEAVPYCGGGIAASITAFWLHRLGHPQVRLYDNSLSEWAADPSLPMQTG